MAKQGRPSKSGGAVYKRKNSATWQVRYKDQKGEIVRESAATTDLQQAERFLRDRLDARDEGRLSTLLLSKQLTLNEWADWFVERRSKPPFRSAGNHQQNLNALKFLRPTFGTIALSDITAEAVENYLADRLQSGRRIHTTFGLQLRGNIKPATAHQEFRILSHILNVAVKQKRLGVNPCLAVEFPVSVKKSTRKPHYMTASEQAKIEIAAPNYVRNIVIIVSELGIRYKKELLIDEEGAGRSGKRAGAYRGLEDGDGYWRHATDPSCQGGVPASDRGDAGKRVPVSKPESDCGKTVHDQSAQGLGSNAEESGSAIFRPLRTAAHVRYAAQCGRGRRSHGDPDVAADRRGGFQAVQPSQAWHDARSAGKTRPARQRAGNFKHTQRELSGFYTHFHAHLSAAQSFWKEEILILKGLNGRAAEI